MCDDKIYEYKLLDENLRKERENVLKNYLSSSNEEYDLDFLTWEFINEIKMIYLMCYLNLRLIQNFS